MRKRFRQVVGEKTEFDPQLSELTETKSSDGTENFSAERVILTESMKNEKKWRKWAGRSGSEK